MFRPTHSPAAGAGGAVLARATRCRPASAAGAAKLAAPLTGHTAFMGEIRIKRIYDPPERGDGYRALVDRVWPRGVSRERAQLDEWAKDLAPSSELRRWFGHDPNRFKEFGSRYRAELAARPEPVEAMRRRAEREPVTLLYAARDPRHNHALVLAEVLRGAE
jgi:uncharacterized protein YeaO (DUF488 family)